VIWAIFLFGMTSLFIFGFFRAKDFERQGRLWMPSLSILLAIAFLVWFPSPFSLSVPAEVAPSIQASTQITQAVLKEAPLWGTGPGTYVFNYSLYHGPEVNSTDFWNTRFDRATSFVQTLLPTMGIVGASVFALFVIALFIRSIVQMLRPRSREDWLQAFVFFSPWLTLVFAAWLYSFNFTLMALFFTLAGLLGSQVIRKPYTKSYDASPGLALLFSTVLVGGSVLLFVGIFIASERYVGELAFARALRMDASNGSLQEVVSLLDTASTLNRLDDRYYRTLSEALLLRVNEQLTSVPNTAQLTAESRQYIQALVAASVNAAVHATELSPQNALNWDTRGRVYRELVTPVPEASQFAVVAHLTGTQLEPLSPRVWNELGKTYLVAVEHERALSVAEDPATAKAAQARVEENLKQAEQAFGRAIQLKPNYAPAHFQLGLTYERQGRTDDAIGKLASVLTFNKEDVGVAFELGQLYLSRDQTGDLALAQTQFEHAVELAPAFSNARWFLASVYERTGETTKAIEQVPSEPDNELVNTSRVCSRRQNTEPVAPSNNKQGLLTLFSFVKLIWLNLPPR
jgi:tetratricopeptide (TPR) repeat protein